MRVIAETERKWLDDTDIVFFYFEASNPSGLGSAFEVGYAVARGIPVIFVDEKLTSHSEWLGVHCDEVYRDIATGLNALTRWVDRVRNVNRA
jgi:nucleoside 2-deoxyribosyltransferase